MRQTDKTIKYVEEGSYAWEAGIKSGDKLLKINGHDFHDILEYRYLMSEYEVELEVEKALGLDGKPQIREDIFLALDISATSLYNENKKT